LGIGIKLSQMLRLIRRASLLLAAYVAPLAAAVVAGFLAAAVGLWAAIIWGAALAAAIVVFVKQKRLNSRVPPDNYG